ncbi:DUF2254 domain-containing protein [Pseudoalteromonas sp. SG44-8]|uniref:DUF2254 domain-containing protein n=1 Tax=Pseudoalteromonas sp. SG44-8 TaxID=2760958 RepID=UPI001603FD3D|nr:DUF2254 domain-containing protein [Pseudoalteromonas sp. SG44-8]MBB1399777.1 DUF2254 domain-containing protein [Pseudoalteromonas sp. SG44-8]
MQKVRLQWDNLRASFWFLPSMMVTVTMAFAILLIELDYGGFTQWLNRWPRFFGVEAQGARQILSTLAGSMMTIMSITFSMTLLALVLASGQYTSRILRNFMRSRVTQSTLGVFASIFAYCLIVLRTIRGTGNGDIEQFVPSLAVFFAFVMSLVGVVVLIYFIHHIASSIQASSIIASVAQETNAAIDRLLPIKSDYEKENEPNDPLAESLDERTWYPVPAKKSGYIQDVNLDTLLSEACLNRTIVRMERGIGEFLVQDTPLVSLALTYPPEQTLINALNAAYSISRHRTVKQDPAFGIRQIEDMAIKALSPGVNDTSTAVMCVDYLTAILARLAGRQFPSRYRYESQSLRLVVIAPSFEKLLAQAINQIRGNAEGNVVIVKCLLNSLDCIASLTHRRGNLSALDQQVTLIGELSKRSIKCKNEREQVDNLLLKVKHTLYVQADFSREDHALHH